MKPSDCTRPAVALVADDALLLPAGERMRAGRADLKAPRPRPLARERAEREQLAAGGADVRAGRGGDLKDRLQQLGLDAAGGRILPQDRVDLVREVQRAGVEDHQLLLDADRVARPGELVLHLGRPPRGTAPGCMLGTAPGP